MNKQTDEETIRSAFEAAFPGCNLERDEEGDYTFSAVDAMFTGFCRAMAVIPGGIQAAAALLNGSAVVVPKQMTRPICHALFGLEPTPDEYADYADFIAINHYKP